MKKFIIAIILLVITIAGIYMSEFFIKDIYNQIDESTIKAIDAALNNETDLASSFIYAASDCLTQHESLLYFMCKKSSIDELAKALIRARSLLSQENTDEFCSCAEQIRFNIKQLTQEQYLCAKTLF